MPKSGGVDVEEDWAFAELAGHSWSWYFMDPSKLHMHTNAAALIREICRGVQTGVSTDGARPGVDLPERLESRFPGRTGEGVDRGASKLCARVRNVKLLSTQSINGLYQVSQLCPRTIMHSESNGAG